MRKKLLNTKLWLITMMLALFSSGNLWADDELYSTCLFGGTHGKSNNYTSTWTATNGTFSWSVSNGNTNGASWNYVKFGRNGYTSIGIVQTSAAYTEAITKVDITIDNINASKINSITLYTSSNGSSWSSAGTFTKATGTKTVSLSSPAANLYYKIEFDCASGSSNGLISVSKIEFYKEKAAIAATALSVKTAPTKLNYRVGEKLDLTGLVLSATIGGTPTDVTSGYTSKINSTTVTSGSTTLSTVGAHDIEFSYGGQTTTQTIHVGELKGIEVTTDPTKTTYDAGQTFDATGMVVTATFSDKETSETTWDAVIPLKVGTADGYTFSPDDELETTDDNVEVSYTWGDVTKTDNVSITVNTAVPYTVTFNKGTGTCATTFLTEESAKAGVELPTATIGITGWAFAGWATSSVTNTGDKPTLYDAGDTYYPSDNITLYAVYKFSYKSSTIFTRATSVSDITSADKIVIAYNDGKVLNTSINLSTTLSETSGKVTPNSNAIFNLSGDNTNGYTLTNGTNTIGTSGSGTSLNIALSSTNNKWTFSPSTYTTNVFHVNNVSASKSLDVYNSAWKAYALTENGQAWSMRIYVPETNYVYNSNPATFVNPTVAFTTTGDKTLYVQNTNEYTNAANVTGISKTITYTSGTPAVATVDENGVVTALKSGTTTITATVAAETGVNSEATASYVVTVKDASNVAGLKAITSTSSVVSFTADLTDAVVTYVKGSHAFIQDASGAVYASCGSSLTAGKKINGAVSGSIKAAYQIDEITAITLSGATVTDGDIPSAQVKTAAQLVANKTDLEGKLVRITGATVTASLTSGSASGGKISDDSKTTEINLYAPDSNIDALKDAEGTFNGYITLHGGSSIRFNIFEQSQITLTKNAPMDQPLVFDNDAVELDEDTDDFNNFTGQEVNGAKNTVTYTVDSDDDDVVTSINSSTGVIVLSGNHGTATIKASAAAKADGVDENDIPTPYNATTKTYTISVYPRYTVTFSVNGKETELREATHGAGVSVPTPKNIAGHKFQGWNTTTVAATNTKPNTMVVLSGTFIPENDCKYYAVYALEGETVEHTSTFTIKQSSAPSSPYVNDGSSWTWSNITFQDGNNACINSTNGSVTFTLPSGGKAVSLTINKTSNAWAGAAEVKLKDASSNSLKTFSLGSNSSDSYSFTSTYNQSASYTLTNSTDKNAWIDNIVFEYTTRSISDYCTSLTTGITTTSNGEVSGKGFFASYSNQYAFEVPDAEDMEVYAVTLNDAKTKFSTVQYEPGSVVPAGAGVLVSTSSATTVNVAYSGETGEAIDGDCLHGHTSSGTIAAITGDNYYYRFAKNATKGVGFYWGANDGGVFSLGANKSYLAAPKSLDIRGFAFGEEDELTAILNVEVENSNKAVYDMQGRRVTNPQRGQLYIVNGKKVLY